MLDVRELGDFCETNKKILSARNLTEVSEENRGALFDVRCPDGGYTPLAPAETEGGWHRGCCRCHTECRGWLLDVP